MAYTWTSPTPSGNSYTISGIANTRAIIQFNGLKASAVANFQLEYSTDGGSTFSSVVLVGGALSASQPGFGWIKLDGLDAGHVTGEEMNVINQSTVTAPQAGSATTRFVHAFNPGAAITDVRISLSGGATFAAGTLDIGLE